MVLIISSNVGASGTRFPGVDAAAALCDMGSSYLGVTHG